MPQEQASLSAHPQTSDEYRELEAQHHEFEDRLNALAAKAVLSDEEQIEETTLKKKKLQIKDRMRELSRRGPQTAASAS